MDLSHAGWGRRHRRGAALAASATRPRSRPPLVPGCPPPCRAAGTCWKAQIAAWLCLVDCKGVLLSDRQLRARLQQISTAPSLIWPVQSSTGWAGTAKQCQVGYARGGGLWAQLRSQDMLNGAIDSAEGGLKQANWFGRRCWRHGRQYSERAAERSMRLDYFTLGGSQLHADGMMPPAMRQRARAVQAARPAAAASGCLRTELLFKTDLVR